MRIGTVTGTIPGRLQVFCAYAAPKSFVPSHVEALSELAHARLSLSRATHIRAEHLTYPQN
eukprot:scaffold1001_cov169-Amphora_coffeaeformis.AAC.20